MSMEKIPVMIPVENIPSIPFRLFGAAATAGLLAKAAGSEGAEVGDALELLAHELSRLACDLDVATWPNEEQVEELRQATRAALNEEDAS